MGVTSILVEDGIRLGALREGLKEFSEKNVMHLRKTTKGGSNYHKIQIHL
jgi:magnesium-dependent phosphatase 1